MRKFEIRQKFGRPPILCSSQLSSPPHVGKRRHSFSSLLGIVRACAGVGSGGGVLIAEGCRVWGSIADSRQPTQRVMSGNRRSKRWFKFTPWWSYDAGD